MDYENGTYDFILNKPIDVHVDGEGKKEVVTLVMREPSREHSKKALKLKQMATRAMIEASTLDMAKDAKENIEIGEEVKEKTQEERAKESEGMITLLTMALELSEKVDLGDFVETFIEMAEKTSIKPVVAIDGQYTFKSMHTEQISPDELQRLAVTYVSFFITPSMMKGQ